MSIKVYGFWRSIASFRIRVALKLKALPFEEISIDILQGEQFKPGYDAVNPEHVVPTFIHDGHTLYQSLAIMEYLDDVKPSPRLLPDDIKERAYARSLALMTIADAHPFTVPRVRSASHDASSKSSPTGPTGRTSSKNDAASAKWVSAPPSMRSREPDGVFTASYAIDPTTVMLTRAPALIRTGRRRRAAPAPCRSAPR